MCAPMDMGVRAWGGLRLTSGIHCSYILFNEAVSLNQSQTE